jgi:hypothetical protein
MIIHVEVLPDRARVCPADSPNHNTVDGMLKEWALSRGDVLYVNEAEYELFSALRSMVKKRPLTGYKCAIQAKFQSSGEELGIGNVGLSGGRWSQIRFAVLQCYEVFPYIHRESFEFLFCRAFVNGIYRSLAGGSAVVVLMQGDAGPLRQFDIEDDYRLLRTGIQHDREDIDVVDLFGLCDELDRTLLEA